MDKLLSFIAFGAQPIELREQYPMKVINSKCEKAIRKGYMECGVSARTGWITVKGFEYLEDNNL